jgi:hypothetical protein
MAPWADKADARRGPKHQRRPFAGEIFDCWEGFKMTQIHLDAEAYWTYYEYLGDLLNHVFTIAEGGQLKNRGSDNPYPPELQNLANKTIATFEKMPGIIQGIVFTLRENLPGGV